MQLATGWWGVQLMADTQDEAKMLRDIEVKCKVRSVYERGDLNIMQPEHADAAYGFTADEIRNALAVLEIHR